LRLQHFQDRNSKPDQAIWLGGLFSPKGFLTASRQMTARALAQPMESLHVYLSRKKPEATTAFPLRGIFNALNI
jgi:hypothetical protein